MRRQLLLLAALATCCAVAPACVQAQARTTETIPLQAGLTLVEADPGIRGDEEAIYHIDAVSTDGVAISMSNGGFGVRRFVRRVDLEYAHRCLCSWTTGLPRNFAGATANGTSASVLHDLATRGSSLFIDMWRQRDPTRPNDVLIGQSAGIIYREPDPVSISLLLNDQLVKLPVVHARGNFTGTPVDFYWLDERNNPLLVHGDIGSGGGWLVKLYVPSGDMPRKLQAKLAAHEPATLFGIYFESGTPQLRGESLPALNAIARVLHDNPSWRVRIAVHTDNLNGWNANLNLARLRAGVLASLLEQRFAIAPGRFDVIGAGAADPLGDNTTLAGRALNRRLVVSRY